MSAPFTSYSTISAGGNLYGNLATVNMDVDNAIKSFQDPVKTAQALQTNPELAATLDAFTKGQFDNLPKTKEGLQTLADATGLKVDVLLTTVTSYQDAKGTTDKKLIAIDVNEQNRADTLATLGHEESHARGGTSETLADLSGYTAQLMGEAAIGSHDQTYLNAMKFELGTGQDSQTQTANGVLLGNNNQTLLDAYNDHQLEFYLKSYEDPRLYGAAFVSEVEAKQKAIQLADGLAWTSTQAGRVSATAASVGAGQVLERDPMAAASFTISGISGWVGLGAGAMEQLVRPNTGKVLTETPIDLFSNFMQKKYGTAALFVNETAELVKNNTATQHLQDSINNFFKGDKK